MAKNKHQNHKKRRESAVQSAKKIAKREEARRERKLQKRKKIIKITALTAAAVVIVGAVSFSIYKLLQNNGVFLRANIAAESQHFTINNAMYCYYYDSCYQSYLHYFESNPDGLQFDPDKKLKRQTTEDGSTWYSYFVDNTNEAVETVLKMCESAYDADFKLTDEQRAACQKRAAELDRSNIPSGVRVEDIAEAMELEELAASYHQYFTDQISITDEEIVAYYEDNPAKYLTWDMLCYTFSWAGEEGQTTSDDGTIRINLSQEQATQYANELAAIKDPEEFKDYVMNFLTTVKKNSQEDAQKIVNAMKLSTNGTSYSNEISKWVLEDNAKVGDTTIITKDGYESHQVYLLTAKPERNESETVDFRTIVLSYANAGSEEEAYKKAESIVQEWQDAGADEAAFADMASKYSEDSQTYANGGLSFGYAENSTTYGENAHKWLFEEKRAYGDYSIIKAPDASKGSGAIVIAYFVEDNPNAVWQNQVYEDLYDAETGKLDDANKLQRVTFHDDNLQKLDF